MLLEKCTYVMHITGHFYEKPIGTSETGNLVFSYTPAGTLDIASLS